MRPGHGSRWAAGLAAVLALAAGGCGGPGVDEAALEELLGLYAAERPFELRARLDTMRGDDPRLAFLRGAVAHAFNDPAGSNGHLEALGPEFTGLPDTLRAEAILLRFRNHTRLTDYPAALAAAEALASLPAVDSSIRADVANERRLVAALVDVPAQRVVARAPSEIHRRPDTRLPVTVGDSVRGYVFDTGAGWSTLMRSEAEALGLEVREVGVEVGTSLDNTLTADVAVAPRVRLGRVELANVAFLVVPDEVLTFTPEFRIPGIIGFPVIDALGEVVFERGGVLRIPGEVPTRSVRNLALDYLTPLVRTTVLGDDAVCELDTGANRTSLHLPFYRAHRDRIEASGRVDTLRTAGVGSERRIPVYVLEDVRLEFADTAAVLEELNVYTESVVPAGEADAECRLGLDVLAGFEGYVMNFRSMAFLPL